MSWELHAVMVLTFVAVILGVLRWTSRPMPAGKVVARIAAREGTPRWVSWISRLGDASVSAVLPPPPTLVRDRLNLSLERADLDDALDVGQWMGASLSLLCGVGLIVGVLATPAIGVAAGIAVAALPLSWIEGRRRRLARAVSRDLPGLLDLMTLAIEAGCAIPASISLATRSMPRGLLRSSLERAMREVRAGRAPHDAWRDVAVRCPDPGIEAFIAALVQAETSGISIGPLLRSHSQQRQEERFARAEKAAMKAPVKLLLPLIACIFPCAFLVIGFPIAHRLMTLV